MICQTCQADVHPQPYRITAGHCQQCKAEILGIRAFDDKYACGACGYVDRVSLSTKWIHKCPAAHCGARMASPTEDDEATSEQGHDEPTHEATDEMPGPRVVRPVAKLANRSEPIDPVMQCKERLVFVRERIAELRAYEKEERRLSRMLAAVEADDLAAE